jgi:large subunit ribosomal protein L24
MRIKKGDNVKMLAGKDRGKTGKVLRALPQTSQVIVEGVNMQKRHEKAKKNTKQGAGIIEVTAPVHISNVALVDPKSNKATRVGKVFDDSKKKFVRVAKASGTKLA